MRAVEIIFAHNRSELLEKITRFEAREDQEPTVIANANTLKEIIPQYIDTDMMYLNFSFNNGDNIILDGIKYHVADKIFSPDLVISIGNGTFIIQGDDNTQKL